MTKEKIKQLNTKYYKYLILFFMGTVLLSCAFGHKGSANTSYFDIKAPDIPLGTTKIQLIRMLGVPDSNISFAGKEYWCYRNTSGWYILLGGKTKEKDLILEIEKEKVTKSYIKDRGFSFGILMIQGATAN